MGKLAGAATLATFTSLLVVGLVLWRAGDFVSADVYFIGALVPVGLTQIATPILRHVIWPNVHRHNLSAEATTKILLIDGVTLSALLGVVAGLIFENCDFEFMPGFEAVYYSVIALTITAVPSIVLVTYLQIKKKMLLVEYITVIVNLLLAMALALPINYDVSGLALISPAKHALIMVFAMLVAAHPILTDRASVTRRALYFRAKRMAAALAYYKSDASLDKFISALLLPGDLTTVSLAQQIISIFSTIQSKVLIVPYWSRLNSMRLTKNWPDQHLNKTLGLTMLTGTCALIAIGLATNAYQNLRPGHMLVSQYDGEALIKFLVVSGLAFVLSGASQVMAYRASAAGDVKAVVRIGMLTFTVSLFCKVFLVTYFGVLGLAMTLSLTAVFNALQYLKHGLVTGRSGT